MLGRIKERLARTQDNEGATAVEYGIMVALIAVVIIGAVFFIGQALEEDFSCVGSAIANSENASTAPC